MSNSLQSRLDAELGPELGSRLEAVTPAWLGMKGIFPIVLAGVIGGTLIDLVLDTELRPVFIGLGAGIAIMIGMVMKDQNARADRSRPGGLYVILGATSDELILVGRSMWSMKDFQIEQRRPFTDIDAIEVNKSFLGSPAVTFRFSDGDSWRYEVNKWKNLQPALPQGPLNAES